jgi:phage terminase large subunit
MQLNRNLRGFFESPRNDKGERIRNRVLYGGRSSGKSWMAAGMAVFFAQAYKVRILCARQIQNKLEESMFALIVKQIDMFGLRDQFQIKDSKIVHRQTGSEILFYGLWRHISEIKSLEDIDICISEESHDLTERQWDILSPTLRKDYSQFWLLFNPSVADSFVWKRFVVNPPSGTIVRCVNYDENPYLSQTIIDVIEDTKREDFAKYQHIYLGVPNANDDDAVIKRSWVIAAVNGHKELNLDITGSRVTGFDVADSGSDSCATVTAHGVLNYTSDLWKAAEDELLKSTARVYSHASKEGAEIVYDAIGVGAHVGAKVDEMNADNKATVRHSKFFAGSGVYKPDSLYAESKIKNRDYFANVKAQAWWMIADRFRNTYNAVQNGIACPTEDMIFIAEDMPNLQQLIDELCTPRRDFDASGKVKVESKKDLAKNNREGGPKPSPNLADAFVMANVAPYVRSRTWFG